MQKPIPWKAAATIAVKRRGEDEFLPEIAGMTLNAALEYASNATLPPNATLCIWVNWHGEEVWIQGPRIAELADDPDRPAVRAD